jgi:hypothetical protein
VCAAIVTQLVTEPLCQAGMRGPVTVRGEIAGQLTQAID